jgi:hypothetical protein
MCYLSYGETPLVNYGPRSYFHHIAITCLLYSYYLLYSHILLFSTRYAHNLCFKQTGEIDNLIASWEQSTWLCCVQVPRCYWPKTSQQVRPCWSVTKPVCITFSRYCPFSPRSTYLGFLTEGKLAAILITPSSWGSQRAGCSPRTRTINCIFTRQLGVSKVQSADSYMYLAAESRHPTISGRLQFMRKLLFFLWDILGDF